MVTSFPLNFSGFRTRSQKVIVASEPATDSDRKRISKIRLRIRIVFLFIHRYTVGARLFFGRAIEDYADLFEGDEAAVNHFVEAGENLLYTLGGLDDFEDDRQILREAKKFIRVVDAGASVAADAAQHRRAGEAVFAEHFDDGFVERFAMPFIGFADMDAHQGALAFKFLVRHGGSVTSDSP